MEKAGPTPESYYVIQPFADNFGSVISRHGLHTFACLALMIMK